MFEKELRLGKEILLATSPLVALYFLTQFGFNYAVKDRVAVKQKGVCPVCGNALDGNCEGHHRVPESLGGSNHDANCVVVHNRKPDGSDCHQELDNNALELYLIFISSEEPAVPIEKVPTACFKSNKVKSQVVRRCKKILANTRW